MLRSNWYILEGFFHLSLVDDGSLADAKNEVQNLMEFSISELVYSIREVIIDGLGFEIEQVLHMSKTSVVLRNKAHW